MSTTTLSAPLNIAVSVNRQAPAPEGARRLSALLLAAVLATLVVIADQVIDTWADGHLMLAWVILWALVFAGLALFADGARRLARRSVAALDDWSRSLAEARAEMRLWEMARQDPRLMSELVAARNRAEVESEAASVDFSDALAPIGLPDAAGADTRSYLERLAESRMRQAHLHYV
ncbi:MAG: hypothetical protein ACO1OR_12615 [Hydrogenophaga sp.]|jgi:hypothetical protein|uniref:hypothetical protein n=1 Tax=Hydrogenophaga intermedia TaxID=65786 RepID=UPI002044B8C4|nr:hypothetical protein [Hydrogenophaga intermedia]MCM3566052.1 hypothetical protein [Hydrogenophaga intermedia]